MASAFSAGLLLGLSLIAAIGAQNAYLLRQGLRREHVLPLVLVCAVSDALLIVGGVAGLGRLVAEHEGMLWFVTLGGALFLSAYGFLAAWRAFLGGGSLDPAGSGPTSLRASVMGCLAFTWLNPHVYLDTVVLVGGLSATWAPASRPAFGAGAASASFLWFFGLGYAARLLAPVLARPGAWRALDGAIALVMWGLAAGLFLRL